MRVGIIGSGNLGTAIGFAWAAKGHSILFSFARDPEKLRAVAARAGANARAGTPGDAAKFGEVTLLAVPWGAVPEAVKAAGLLEGRVLFSCVNSLKPDFSGLAVGTTTSAAEEIAKLAPGAKVVAAIPPMAELLASSTRRLGGQQISTFFCGDDPEAKKQVARLICDLDLEPVDAGPLTSARYIEPAGMLAVQLAYGMGLGTQIGMRLLRA
jgi:8-hydroxy-5-deazaflavin:NADPH oxidoreductase